MLLISRLTSYLNILENETILCNFLISIIHFLDDSKTANFIYSIIRLFRRAEWGPALGGRDPNNRPASLKFY